MNGKKFITILLILALFVFSSGLIASAEASYAYEETELQVMAPGGYQIPATLTLPIGAEGELFPAVLMLHGNGSNRHEAGTAYDTAAPLMAQAGIATIRFDFMGNGDSAEDYVGFSKNVGVEEAMACYAYVAALDTVDAERVGIMGWSMGGGISLLTAARNDVFKSVLTWAGSATAGDTVSDELYAIAKEQGYYVREYGWREPLKIGLEAIDIDMSTNTLEEIANIKAPILAINGLEDDVVLPEVAQSIVDASTHSDSMLLLLKAEDHTFHALTGDMSSVEKLTNATIAWFLNTLK